MGSLATRPKIPTPSPQIVYVPAPTVTSTTKQNTNAGTSSGAGNASGGDTGSNQGLTAGASTPLSLLDRTRGRFGTITTSFRGLLGNTENASGRKTLLGE